MSLAPESSESHLPASDRRSHSRQQLRALAYVKLGEDNGGIVLNLSEGGLSVQAVMSLMGESLPRMRFQLSPSQDWIETAARVVWVSDAKKVAGLQFIDLPHREHSQIREWLSQEIVADRAPKRENGRFNSREGPAIAPAASESGNFANWHAEPELAAATSRSLPGARTPALSQGTGASWTFNRATDLKLERSGPVAGVRTLATTPRHGPWALIVLIALLASISLAAGWVMGRGKANEIVQQVLKIASRDGGGPQHANSSTAGPVARVSEIEVVDTNNQRWVIPFNAPPIAADQNKRAEPPHTPPPQFHKARPTFPIGTLSPPRQAQRVADSAGSEKQSPPIPTIPIGVPGGAESISRSSVELPKLGSQAPQFVPPPTQQVSLLDGGALIRRVEPVYPALAQGQRIEGTVRLHAAIGEDGAVRSVEVVSGPVLLVEAAAGAVRKWRFSPTLLNGKPVGITKDIDIVFRLRDASN